MKKNPIDLENYFSHLKSISFLGRIYKKYFSSRILYFFAKRFGKRIVEIGSGTGSGVLGAYPNMVTGFEINSNAVQYCQLRGMRVKLIEPDNIFPTGNCSFDACILDNVLEHIDEPRRTLDECHRITSDRGGLIIVVPGLRGYASDSDHKKFYTEQDLRHLDERWKLVNIFSIPFFFNSEVLSKRIRQYCLVAVYEKTEIIG